jgi:hypothetical protein
MSLQLAIDEVFGLQNVEGPADHRDTLTESRIQQTEV